MEIRVDCRNFPGDRPCAYHKTSGITCQGCGRYEERGTSILIIKFEALGDVLRTTSLLPSLKRKYGSTYITWITSREAVPLFIANPHVDEVLSDAEEYLPVVLAREFDIVINPDASGKSCNLASIANAEFKHGFVASPRGVPVALGDSALEWLRMGGNDEIKRSNTKTYQQIIHEMCALDDDHQHIVLRLTDREIADAERIAMELNLYPTVPVVGINTGAGSRWNLKRWTISGFADLIHFIVSETHAQVLLFGGPDDLERNRSIVAMKKSGARLRQASSLRELFQLIHLCDVIVTGDTLVAHASVALGKRTVVLFGPTSASEFDLYGLGEKIVAPVDCVCCYKQVCDRKPNCMDLIKPETVFEAVKRQILRISKTETERIITLVGEPGS